MATAAAEAAPRRRFAAGILLALLFPAACAAVPGPPSAEAGVRVELPLRERAAVDHPRLDELSGLLRRDGGYWAHNDSGAEPRLFALDDDFDVVIPAWQTHRYGTGDTLLRAPWPGIELIGATLVDWESMARIGDTLYIADVGNNGNARRDLGLWVLREPAAAHTETLRPLHFQPLRYPEQTRFPGERWEWDCEAVFSDGDALYFVTKHRVAGEIGRFEAGAKLYRFEPGAADGGASNEGTLDYVSRQPDLLAATGADLSPDGELLAVLSYSAVWFFRRPVDGRDWFAGTPAIRALPVLQTRQIEAVAWQDDDTLVIANEAGDVFDIDVDRARIAAALQSAFSAETAP